MRVIILGSGTLVPNGVRGPAGYAVLAGERRVLMDGGSGTLRRLAEAGVDYRRIDDLLYTHIHPDHTGDLIPFLFAQRHTPGFTRTRPIRIVGPRGFAAFFSRLRAVYDRWIGGGGYAIEVEEHWGDGLDLEGLRIDTVPMRHSVAAIGYRLTGAAGETVAYTGDTDETPAVSELARAVDVLISECSTPDEAKVEGHLTPGLAGKLAAVSGARMVVLSHHYPLCETSDVAAQCRRRFAGRVVVAHDLMTLDVSPAGVVVGRLEPQVGPGATPAGAGARDG